MTRSGDPYDPANVNPNSYNLTLHDELMVYEELVLDMRKANRVRRIVIPPEGFVLQPNQDLTLADDISLLDQQLIDLASGLREDLNLALGLQIG